MVLCREGFEQVRKNVQREMNAEFQENGSTEKLKTYVVVDSVSENKDDTVYVVPAYKCPTVPAIYIHVNFEDDEEAPIFLVISKTRRAQQFSDAFDLVLDAQIKLVRRIDEGRWYIVYSLSSIVLRECCRCSFLMKSHLQLLRNK
jgi:hypothetical protein